MERNFTLVNDCKINLVAPDKGRNEKDEPSWSLTVTAPFMGSKASDHLAHFDATISEQTLVNKAIEMIQRLAGLSSNDYQMVEFEIIRHLFHDYQSSLRQVGTFSAFPFFNGDRFVVVLAPDHPELPEQDEPYWYIDTRTGTGETLSVRLASQNISMESLNSVVFDALYQGISSNETDKRRPEIETWLREVRGAYQTRDRITTPA